MEGQLSAMDADHDRKAGDLIAPKGTIDRSRSGFRAGVAGG